MRPADRERIQVEVVSRIVERYRRRARTAPEGYLETLVNDTLYHERRRLEHASGRQARAQQAFYGEIGRRLIHASNDELCDCLEQMAQRFVAEVVGNFNERVYRFSTNVIPPGMWLLLNAMSPSRIFSLKNINSSLSKHLQVEGEVDHVRGLVDRGTLVMVPTHSSNLDSIVLGYAVYLMGLPPLTYGAGLNLFTNPLLSFFMRNLGAYRVDRKKTSVLYKDILKEYATCSLELGYNNLFFPGGTRSRSGAVEQKLKLGLLGTAVRAYIGNLRSHKAKPDLFIVPCTLSYKLVLEAETLIDDHLKEMGKSRYIIEDDESTKFSKVAHFFRDHLALDSRIVVTLAQPLDVFGNRVNREGQSVDARGRAIDIQRYVIRDGEPVYDAQRDAQYTRELGEGVRQAILRYNLVMSTHLVAYSLFNLMQRYSPEVDLYRLLRTGGRVSSFPMEEVHQEVERVLGALKDHERGPRLGPLCTAGDIQSIVADALKHFSIYHTRPAAVRRGDRVFPEDRNLLLFYGNRLHGYDLGRILRAARNEHSTTGMTDHA